LRLCGKWAERRTGARIAIKNPIARTPIHPRLFDEYWTKAPENSAKSLILWRTAQDKAANAHVIEVKLYNS
jgi:hypothetical protein